MKMRKLKFSRELYSKIALIKAAYNFTDKSYVHLDADEMYYYVSLQPKVNEEVGEQEFVNEILTQSVRHEVYQQTKNVRELILARAMASSVIAEEPVSDEEEQTDVFLEENILKDWFAHNED